MKMNRRCNLYLDQQPLGIEFTYSPFYQGSSIP
jgi:hypothetical protein